MDMKEKLREIASFSKSKYTEPKLIYLLGLFGLVMILGAAWLSFSDSTASRAAERAKKEGEAVLGAVLEPVRSLKQVFEGSAAQELAVAAVDNPDSAGELLALVREQVPAVQSIVVYGTDDIAGVNPVELGENGYAVMDMLLSVLEGKQSLMQVHGTLVPLRLLDAVPVRSGEDLVGVMVISADPAVVVDAFQPDHSSLGFVRLAQYNGRQAMTTLKEFGDSGLAGEVPERLAIPGTKFRVEYPLPNFIDRIGGVTFILLSIVGLSCMGIAFFLFQANRKYRVEMPKEIIAAPEPSAPAADAGDSLPDAVFDMPVAAGPPPGENAEVEVREIEEVELSEEPATPVEAADEPPRMRLHYDFDDRRRQKEKDHAPVDLDAGIFRAYDIRGIIDKTLDSGIARSIGQAVGSQVLESEAGPVVVARDGRLSGPFLMKGLIEGILSTGCDVLDIGAVPTGVLYYAAHEFANGSAVMITGSHNPPDYNGFKVMVDGDTLYGDAIMDFHRRIVEQDFVSGNGQHERKDVIADYMQRIADDVHIEKPLRVVLDCGNGIGGVCGAETLRELGVEVIPLYDEVDGTFPNHHPDPSEPENLKDLIESVRLMDADLGLALDGDADRLGVVTMAGDIIYPDRVLMLLALDVLDRVPGATILYDVKCTGHLARLVRAAGGNPIMYKTGHSLMKAKMKELGCPFAGEMSGHFFFGERWYGVDDGIYAAARLLEVLGGTETPPEAILNALPTSFSTPELKVEMQEGENHAFVEAFKDEVISKAHIAAHFEGAEINTIDGLRADFKDGWGLVRASNTTPVLIVRFDAESEQALERIKMLFRRQMLELNPDLELPF